jgi:hypothetical protein
MIKAPMAKTATLAPGIVFKFIMDSTFHGISRQRLKIGDEARLKQTPTDVSQRVIQITEAT